jgi:hypothetical protein
VGNAMVAKDPCWLPSARNGKPEAGKQALHIGVGAMSATAAPRAVVNRIPDDILNDAALRDAIAAVGKGFYASAHRPRCLGRG